MTLTPTGELAVFEAGATEGKKLAAYQVSESKTYAGPVVAGKNIYVKDKDSVTLWAIE